VIPSEQHMPPGGTHGMPTWWWELVRATRSIYSQHNLPGQIGTQPGFAHSCLPSRRSDLFPMLASWWAEPTSENAARERQKRVKYCGRDMLIDAGSGRVETKDEGLGFTEVAKCPDGQEEGHPRPK
jgi:hypothetical protein